MLESCCVPVPDSGPRDAVVGSALVRVSTPDLIKLIEACESQRPYDEWSSDQVSAGESLRGAMEAECLQAGFKSVAQFEQLCPVIPPATTFRRAFRSDRR